MKKINLLLFLIISNFITSQTTVTKNLGDFKKIKVYNGINLELIRSNEQKIQIQGEKAEKIKVKNTNGILKIRLKFPEISASGKVEIKLFYKNDIHTIDANEGAEITGNEIKQKHLEIKAQEGAFIDLDIKAKHLKIKSSSGGIVKLTGSTKNQEVELDLYGVYHGYGLNVSDYTMINAGTGAKAEVKPGEILDAKVSFGGSIFYKGTPEVVKNKKVAGGIIKQMN
ncbi:MAG: Uncharacterised protein [Flavobacterium sp. SCGC AAA160-P02]|nr:MAG: Uncharacterised protein [Flavobacterium sp. SCGC AAA160-P02]